MSNYKHFCICDQKECKLFLENPIVLPCGSTICKEHVENCKDKYTCTLCNLDHVIPESGFPSNKLAIKINESRVHLNEMQMITIDSYEKLEKKIKEHESLESSNSENLIFDYYSNLRNQVDLHREQLIEEINKRSEKIIKQLKELEEKCRMNAAKLTKMNLDHLKNEDMIEYKIQLRQPDLKDFVLSKLFIDINDKIDDIQDDLNKFKNDSLINQNIQFKKDNSNLFGELKVEDIQKPIKTVANRAEATLKFVINNFSKFKESGKTIFSENRYILRGLEWKICAVSNKLANGSFELGYYLNCMDNNTNQSKKFPIWVKSTFKLLHLKDLDKNIIRTFEYLYLNRIDSGYPSFISMKRLSDPENGFYDTKKDCITLEVDFFACRCFPN